MKISIGEDERLAMVDKVMEILLKEEHKISFYGPEGEETLPWPHVARQVAEDVAEGCLDEGVLFCWTGTGVSIAANKVPGVRAVLCFDAETARGARLWNDANMLCFSLRLTSEIMAAETLEKWLNTKFIPNKSDSACVAMELDNRRLS